MKEYLLSTNEYLEPEVADSSDAYGIFLVRLLLLEPGTNPLHPKMGVGLGPKYRYLLDTDMDNLQNIIQEQIDTYLPPELYNSIKGVVTLKSKEKYLLIEIVANDIQYLYDTKNSITPVELVDSDL